MIMKEERPGGLHHETGYLYQANYIQNVELFVVASLLLARVFFETSAIWPGPFGLFCKLL